MKLSSLSLTVFAATAASVAYSFAPSRAFVRQAQQNQNSNSVLYISSWGKTEPEEKTFLQSNNPETNIQSYLTEPDLITEREHLDGVCLVSGFVNAKERTDQFVFDLLNYEENAFDFSQIVAFVDDEKFAKKRLLSRSARYTGLLNKLAFKEAAAAGALPVPSQLEGVKSWLASFESNNDLVAQVKAIAALAKDAPDLKNISVMVSNANGDVIPAADRTAAIEALKDTGKEYTLLVVGKLEDRDEGKRYYTLKDFGSDNDEEALLPEKSVFSREEAMRMATETLQLEAGVNKALVFSEVKDTNSTEAKLIKGLREAGYVRPQEIDHMLRDGVANYQKELDEFDEKNPNWREGLKTTEAWWEDPKFLDQLREAEQRERGVFADKFDADAHEEALEEKDERTIEIETIATEWAKREFFAKSMAGTVDEETTQEEFIESVWDRALFEGDIKYRQIHGEDADVEAELLDFKAQQERKQQAMLQKAKQELQDVFDEEDLGGIDDKLPIIDDDEDDE